MFRPSAALVAGLVSLALLTACSDQQKDAPSRAEQHRQFLSPSTEASEDTLENQDEVPDKWPPEVPLPLGYKIEAVSEPTEGKIHSAQVVGLPSKAVRATLDEFESNGFTDEFSEAGNKRGLFRFVNEKWQVDLTAAPMDKNGEPTMEETGVYTLLYMVGPVK